MDNKKQSKVIIIILGVLAALAIVGFVSYETLTIQVNKDKTYELGYDQVSTDIDDYVFANKSKKKDAILDTSKVKMDQVGDYTATCKINGKTFTYNIHVEDTKGPELTFHKSKYGTSNAYRAEDLVDVKDYSKVTKLEITDCKNSKNSAIKIKDDSLVFDKDGKYTVSIKAQDEHKNSETSKKTITVAKAPEFELLANRVYRVGSTYDLLDFVYAKDQSGKDITDQIKIKDNGGYDASKEGDYIVTYSVLGQDDIERFERITIQVKNTDHDDFGVDKKTFVSTLLQHNYFTYQALENNSDTNKLLDLTSPTSFGVKYVKTDGGKGASSGFVYKITENNIYYITNKHCKNAFEQSAGFNLFNYKGDTAYIDNKRVTTHKSSSADLMCVVIPIDCLEADFLAGCKETNFDKSVVDGLKAGQKLLINTQEFGINMDGRVDKSSSVSIHSACETDVEGISYPDGVIVTNGVATISGQSGSPVFDYNGHLVAMVKGYVSVRGTRTCDWGIFVSGASINKLMSGIEIK